MDRKEAIRNISIATGDSEDWIETELEKLFKRYEEAESSQQTCFSDFYPKSETSKPLTPKQYGQVLMTRKKKRK